MALSADDLKWIEIGQKLAARRRAEFDFNHPTPARPVIQFVRPAQAEQPTQTTQQPTNTDNIKIWPTLLLAATKDKRRGDDDTHHSGAARLWFIARYLDKPGSGWVHKADLWAVLAALKVGERKRRRWVSDALGLGLLLENKRKKVYRLAGLARGAVLLGCAHVGMPATIGLTALVETGWKARCWAAYLATTKSRPISQNVKESITGIIPRTQRNLQKAAPGILARKNYAQTQLRGDHLTGLEEHGKSGAFVGIGNKIVYRLPDAHHVPAFYASLAHRGRSRKAQKVINLSSSEGREQSSVLKLFHERLESARAALRELARSNTPPWEKPAEMFCLRYAGRNSNIWDPIAAGGVA